MKIFFSFFSFFYTSLYALDILQIENRDNKLEDFKIEFYSDKNSKLDFDSIKEQTFIPIKNKGSLSINNYTTWFRIQLYNQSSKREELFIHNKLAYVTTKISFIETKKQRILKRLDIDMFEDDVKKKMYGTDAIFPFFLDVNETKTIYIKNSVPAYQLFDFRIYNSYESSLSLNNNNHYISTLAIGMGISFAFYNILILLGKFQKEYVYYILYIIAAIGWEVQISGILTNVIGFYLTPVHQYFWLSVLFVPFFSILFIKSILETEIHYKRENKGLNFILYMILLNVLTAFYDVRSALIFVSFIFVYLSIGITISLYFIYKKNNKIAGYLLVGHMFFLVTSSINALFFLGVVPLNELTFNIPKLGLIMELFIFAFVLSFRLKMIQDSVLEKTKKLVEQERIAKEKDKIIYEQNKLVSMGEMIQNIAHQWRQPLSEINASILIIDNELKNPQVYNNKVLKQLDNIEGTVEYMSSTINDFQNFYEKKDKDIFFLLHSIHETFSLVKATFKKFNIKMEVKIAENIQVNTIKNELQQVILVLLNNARDALINSSDKEKTVFVSLDENYILSIEDNAGGIKVKNINKVFEPYFTTKHKSQGTGLGLYLAKKIIEESLSITLKVENINEGARFSIDLQKIIIKGKS